MWAFWPVKEAGWGVWGGGGGGGGGGGAKVPTERFVSQLNKQYLIWKLTSSVKIWDLSEVTEAHSLASIKIFIIYFSVNDN